MGGVVSAVGNVVSGVVNTVGNLIGIGGGAQQPSAPPPPPPIQPLPNIPSNVPSTDLIRARQDRIRQQDRLRRSGSGPGANILTGAKGDTSLNVTSDNSKQLLGS